MEIVFILAIFFSILIFIAGGILEDKLIQIKDELIKIEKKLNNIENKLNENSKDSL
jgi:hypothetical protein